MKRFIKIAALLLAICALFGMTSCDIIVGELENIVDMLEEDGIGDVLDNVFGDVSDALGKTETMVAFEGKYDTVEIDNKMMSYFFNKHLANWFTTYASYVDLFGLDVNKDLDDQWFGNGSSVTTMVLGHFDGTWQEYFYYETVEEVKLYLVWADYAKSCGIALDEEDLIDIEATIREERENLEKSGSSYKAWYGKGVDEEVIRRCMEIQYLAAKGSDYYVNCEKNNISYSDLENWAYDNREDLEIAECLSYTLTVSSRDMDWADYSSLCDEAKNVAQNISESRSLGEFEGRALTVAGMGYAFDATSKVVPETFSYSDESDAAKWLFSGYVNAGDTTVIEAWNTHSDKESEKHEYEIYTVTVYFVTESPHFDDRLSHSVAYALMNSEDAARTIREEVLAQGVTDGVEFINIAKNYANKDGKVQGSNIYFVTSKADQYAYHEDMEAGFFADEYEALNEWVEDDEREAGDLSDVIRFESKYSYITGGNQEGYNGSFVISGSLTQLGNSYAVALFVGHGEETWKAKARSAIVAERVSQAYEDLCREADWEISGNYERISVADLTILKNKGSAGLTINFSGVSGGITYAPEFSGGITYLPGAGDVEYSYTIIDPNNLTGATGNFGYDYIVTDPNYTIITPTDPSQSENGGN